MSGINSAMLAGVTGLGANSAALSSISDDIANVNTVGYKANDTQFSDLVTNTAGSGYASGGVQALSTQDVTQQGVLQAASSPTDLAISGQGFFVASASAASPSPNNTPLFTRAGAFTPNSQGFLVNSAGLFLQGWQADTNGNVTTDPSNLKSASADQCQLDHLGGDRDHGGFGQRQSAIEHRSVSACVGRRRTRD